MRLISAKTCAALFDVTTTTWRDWCKYDPTAPQPVISTGQGMNFARWSWHEVQKYMRLLIKEKRSGYIKEAHQKKKGEKAA